MAQLLGYNKKMTDHYNEIGDAEGSAPTKAAPVKDDTERLKAAGRRLVAAGTPVNAFNLFIEAGITD